MRTPMWFCTTGLCVCVFAQRFVCYLSRLARVLAARLSSSTVFREQLLTKPKPKPKPKKGLPIRLLVSRGKDLSLEW